MEQFELVKRYLIRLESIYHGVPLLPHLEKEFYDDDVISFFIHCFHVKDWAINAGINKNKVEEYINSHQALMICADFANGSKHCKITKNVRTGEQPYVGGCERFTSRLGDEIPIMQCSYRIVCKSEVIDALVLAKKCVELWRLLLIDECATDT
ncbi:hypothetical protein [Vibrio parahaemolyticus]|uniref:hypothetical protein n=1 Tax=Vibrio parahaemolyticus TaxID=670 RepID=UPI00287A90A2|nr:hypothetical protein [Vibrio parahaemolyticus]MDS1997812.1 hypothetical protein [Vibrio parahaemolyticus]HCH0960581.1 hypothetical protein [Vibrio parahaemolyticus]